MNMHCKVCYLSEDHPGVSLDKDQICTLCRLEFPDEVMRNFAYTQKNFEVFTRSTPKPDADYDCLFMYSGGKDSTYMLDKFVNEEKRRVLAYTFRIPFESAKAVENIAKIRERMPIEYVVDSDDVNIKKLMRYVFNDMQVRKPAKYLDEKKPCAICRSMFVLRAILYAFEAGIPFIIFCADPQQIVTTESDVKAIVKTFYMNMGRELTNEIFGARLQRLLFAREDQLPRIVFPYIGLRHSYDPIRMVRELREKGLYDSTPIETHCSLFPLLNRFAFKNFGCSFYKLNMASEARQASHEGGSERNTFSLRFGGGADIPEIERTYAAVIEDIAARRGKAAEHGERLRKIFTQMRMSTVEADYLVERCLRMHDVAADLGIRLT